MRPTATCGLSAMIHDQANVNMRLGNDSIATGCTANGSKNTCGRYWWPVSSSLPCSYADEHLTHQY